MSDGGGRGARVRRWVVAVWAALVVVGGGVTLWLQDSARPPAPRGWYEAPSSLPTPPTASYSCPPGAMCPYAVYAGR
ncbi:hypothetical protein IAG44_13080 [Streptomyces roseirectus]|uniref:Uncharacterized protein n=1 Tax=Streptomyces roseirectus TaxID=2768066 RepID=A0A7H0IBX1_9ACTN|nr:hypothetical protein [Streptomyces roseirectus]QNP70287.1 hypothetical protein IAG44_13080 [Streptomyces roseirectus]